MSSVITRPVFWVVMIAIWSLVFPLIAGAYNSISLNTVDSGASPSERFDRVIVKGSHANPEDAWLALTSVADTLEIRRVDGVGTGIQPRTPIDSGVAYKISEGSNGACKIGEVVKRSIPDSRRPRQQGGRGLHALGQLGADPGGPERDEHYGGQRHRGHRHHRLRVLGEVPNIRVRQRLCPYPDAGHRPGWAHRVHAEPGLLRLHAHRYGHRTPDPSGHHAGGPGARGSHPAQHRPALHSRGVQRHRWQPVRRL